MDVWTDDVGIFSTDPQNDIVFIAYKGKMLYDSS